LSFITQKQSKSKGEESKMNDSICIFGTPCRRRRRQQHFFKRATCILRGMCTGCQRLKVYSQMKHKQTRRKNMQFNVGTNT
jgi:hypothetical protein